MKHNPLGKVGFVATPESMKHLEEYISRYSGEEAVIANVIMSMTWNLASSTIDKELAKDEQTELMLQDGARTTLHNEGEE